MAKVRHITGMLFTMIDTIFFSARSNLVQDYLVPDYFTLPDFPPFLLPQWGEMESDASVRHTKLTNIRTRNETENDLGTEHRTLILNMTWHNIMTDSRIFEHFEFTGRFWLWHGQEKMTHDWELSLYFASERLWIFLQEETRRTSLFFDCWCNSRANFAKRLFKKS